MRRRRNPLALDWIGITSPYITVEINDEIVGGWIVEVQCLHEVVEIESIKFVQGHTIGSAGIGGLAQTSASVATAISSGVVWTGILERISGGHLYDTSAMVVDGLPNAIIAKGCGRDLRRKIVRVIEFSVAWGPSVSSRTGIPFIPVVGTVIGHKR